MAKWQDTAGGGAKLSLMFGMVRIEVYYDSGTATGEAGEVKESGWRWRVNGEHQSKKTFTRPEQAKAGALAYAHKLAKTLDAEVDAVEAEAKL